MLDLVTAVCADRMNFTGTLAKTGVDGTPSAAAEVGFGRNMIAPIVPGEEDFARR